MKSFLKQINESFESLQESLDSKTAANDPKLFVKTAYDNGYSEKQIENFLQKAGHSKDDAETYLYNIVGQYDTGFASNGINETAKPDYLDFDKDGDKEESMKKALKDKEQNEAVDAKADLNDDGELSSWEQARKDAIDKAMYKEVDEASTTASMGAPPKRPDIFEKKKKKKEYKKVQEAMDRKYEQLIEGYRDFVLSDSKMSPARKVNASIRDVAKKLKEEGKEEEAKQYAAKAKKAKAIDANAATKKVAAKI